VGCRFQGTADAVRQYSWIFADLKNNDMQVRPCCGAVLVTSCCLWSPTLPLFFTALHISELQTHCLLCPSWRPQSSSAQLVPQNSLVTLKLVTPCKLGIPGVAESRNSHRPPIHDPSTVGAQTAALVSCRWYGSCYSTLHQ
jgi:hypothetical protein